MPSASELLPYKPRLHNTMIKKRVNWGTKEARLPPCNQNRKRHCSPRSPSPGNSEPTVETQCWKRPRTREENEVKRERTVGVHSMESSPVLCQGCLALRWEFAGDQAASSIHVANDRNTTGKCWEGRGWLEPLPADTGQVTNSSQGRQIAAAYTESFYTISLHNFLRRQDIYSSTTNAILREIWLGLYKAAPIQHYGAQNTSTKKTKKK